MTKKCAIHLKGGTILNTTYEDKDIEKLMTLLSKRESLLSFGNQVSVYLEDVSAIEWID